MIAMLMSMPVVGGVRDAGDWKKVPVHVMVFLTAAIAIGKVGAAEQAARNAGHRYLLRAIKATSML